MLEAKNRYTFLILLVMITLFDVGLLHADEAPVPPAKALRPIARIEIPGACLSMGPALPATKNRPAQPATPYGGDLRIGDLDGDSVVDFIVFKSVGGLKPCYIGAFTWTGKVLWERGDKDRTVTALERKVETYDTDSPSRPGPVLVVDIDGDDETEVVAMMLPAAVTETSVWEMDDMELVVLNGKTGDVERRAAPEPFRQASAYNAEGKRQVPNFVHQRLLAADFRGTGGPHDFAVKIGNGVLAFNHKLEVLWTYTNKYGQYGRHSSYIPTVGDVDADGKDELCGGNFLIDDDGSVMWEKMMAEHNDSVRIVEWDGDLSNGNEIVLSGFGQVVNSDGEVLVKLGKERVPHGQEVRCGPFREEVSGIQMAVRYNGHRRDILLAGREGRVIADFKVDPTHINVGMETVFFHGRDEPALLYSPASLYNGFGHEVFSLVGMPPESRKGRMGWYHCIPADLDGSGRDSMVIYDAYADEVFVYSAQPFEPMPPKGYVHTQRQWNVRLMD